jgi:rubrerythrin
MKTFFSKKNIFSHRGIRLRHIFYIGTILERQAEAFYRRFAEQSQDNEMRDLYIQLAEEEVRHFKLLDGQLSRWRSLPIDNLDIETVDADGILRQIFLSQPNKNATKKEIIDYAIKQEMKMVAFYKSFEKDFKDFWKETKIQALVAEEKMHIKKLSDMMSN